MKSNLSLRNFPSAQKRREFLEKELNISLDNIGNFTFVEDKAVGRNIENLIGATQIPLGIAGPLLIHLEGVRAHLRGVLHAPRNDEKEKNYFIPLATTEGALVASVSRGAKAVSESGGANVFVENVGITRGPVFQTTGIKHSNETKNWISKNFLLLSQISQRTSHHLTLLKVESAAVGRNLFVRFYFDTEEAMGMNMATIAAEALVPLIEQETKAVCVSLAGNFDIDKKPAWLNFISGRGKRVWAEAILNKNLVKKILKTTPEEIAELVYRKCLLGSIMSGSLGFNAHFANIISAIFIATGQDPAHVVEGSLGVTTAEVLENGDLYFSIYLPSLVVGTVGGGTHLPTQKEALGIMNVSSVLEYSMVIGAAVLAGELSLIASLSEGSLAKAHQRLGRSQNSKVKSKKY